MKKKLVLMTSALMAISLLAGCNSHSHDWGEVIYTWSSDNSTCTAERVCKGDESHKETEVANSTYNVVSEAKCEEDGTGRYSVSFTNEAFTAQTKDIVLEAIGHSWGAATYVWNEDHTECVATSVCSNDSSHVLTENGIIEVTPIVPETCEASGTAKFTATFTNEEFETQEVEGTVKALGHDYQFDSFVWEGFFAAKAKFVCSHDESHVELHDATVTNEVTTQPGCETEGVRTYTASYDGHTDTKTEVIPASEHNWGEPTYVWADDNSTCTATRVCTKDANHVDTETVNAVITPYEEPDCTNDGYGKYTATFTNTAFATQSKDTVITKLGHDWGTPTYVWADDNSTCTATRVCAHDNNHVEEETANCTYTVVTAAKCESDGAGRYSVSFSNEAFTAQTKDVVLEAIGHSWGEPTYVWSDDNLKCTATRVCANDSTHVEEEVATATISNITATCTEDGTSTYTATFKKEGFVAQIKENVPYKALGHDYQFVEFVWDGFTAQAKYVCSHDAAHVELHDAEITNAVTTQPGCETEGVRTYTATYDGHTSTKTGPVSATGHNWNNPTYTWSADNSTCTATRVCTNDESHKETETVDSVYTVVTPATEISEGLGKYTVEFTNSEFVTQEKEITLDKLPYLGRTPILSEDGKTLTYGLYPQTNVDDSTLVSALNDLTTPETNGWYLYNNEYYAKVSATPNNSSYVFDNGTKIVNGTTYWFKCEPITWNILSNNDGECYLLSSVLLDAHCYYNSTSTRTIDGQTIYANNHEYSDIRTWLNNDFYNSAFALGNEHILTTTVDNSASTTDSSSSSYACNNTQDIVFLPSYQDYINSSYGFSTSTSSTNTRYCRTTDWARARGAWYSTSSSYLYNGYYWTRSPDSGYPYGAWYVNDVGRLTSNDVDYTYYSVRPAISIKIA